ncbi:hypothetical protein [Amycolatopsis regifaucium]|uniref:hypothetical protein n=1 Tax=Amycolatopsis regifaucium TaxID=546365 RepID=UPI0008F68A01|nr:hypothetical protein [Amycolatopsis regifaucium]SFJ65326.1 hypothetical protein SAMN04489731_1295 [Amycolatopsis regifaucium]
MSLGVAVYGNILSRELAGNPVTPATTANAVPDMLVWTIPLAAVLLLNLFLPTQNAARATAAAAILVSKAPERPCWGHIMGSSQSGASLGDLWTAHTPDVRS